MARIRIAVAAALAAFSVAAHAGTSGGLVTKLLVESDVVMFVAGIHSGRPNCSLNNGNDWAFSLATPGGRAMYALLLFAQARGLGVSVVGTGDCNAWGDRERPDYVVWDAGSP